MRRYQATNLGVVNEEIPNNNLGVVNEEIPSNNLGVVNEEIPSNSLGVVNEEIPSNNLGVVNEEIPSNNLGVVNEADVVRSGPEPFVLCRSGQLLTLGSITTHVLHGSHSMLPTVRST